MRWVFSFLFLAVLAMLFVDAEALAQSSLGIGRNEQTLPTGGFLEGFFRWVRDTQAEFQQEIRGLLVNMRNDSTYAWSLVAFSFLYGVFHAIGPGHGKVVISSYMVANEVAMRRGVMLSLMASFLQGLTAIAAISFFLIALRGSGIKTGDLAYGLEIASYIGVMAIGLWLIWRKLFKRKVAHSHAHGHDHHYEHAHKHSSVGERIPELAYAHAHAANHVHEHTHAHTHHYSDHHHDHSHHDHAHGAVCSDCGHSHAPDPQMLEGKFGLKEAWGAILAVGLRPCTGALIVLVFCFANGLYVAGVASTLAMSLGTGIAVSILAVLAVSAKNLALKIAGVQGQIGALNTIIEVSAAFLIFLIGFVLFFAAIG